jgi:hypothetical protein
VDDEALEAADGQARTSCAISGTTGPEVPETERHFQPGWNDIRPNRRIPTCSLQAFRLRVDDRIRTGDRLDHNQELYQLSYVHRAASM